MGAGCQIDIMSHQWKLFGPMPCDGAAMCFFGTGELVLGADLRPWTSKPAFRTPKPTHLTTTCLCCPSLRAQPALPALPALAGLSAPPPSGVWSGVRLFSPRLRARPAPSAWDRSVTAECAVIGKGGFSPRPGQYHSNRRLEAPRGRPGPVVGDGGAERELGM